jgi:hypothetical protein
LMLAYSAYLLPELVTFKFLLFLRVPPFPRHSDLSGQAQTLVP